MAYERYISVVYEPIYTAQICTIPVAEPWNYTSLKRKLILHVNNSLYISTVDNDHGLWQCNEMQNQRLKSRTLKMCTENCQEYTIYNRQKWGV